ncbi:MAG: hypothetical protein HYW45_00870 [Candidatus Daviesbacteria bacterium]|nr:MAG: hypothetical protein HYW45_00870 [Candidatus Daviesbacteria bacterium]
MMVMESESKLDTELSDEFLRRMVAWQRLEDTLRNGNQVVDLKLLEIEPGEEDNFPDRESVKNWLEDHIARTPPNSAGVKHAQRCDGLLAFSEAVLGKRESLGVYLSRTLGVTPAAIPDSEIREQRDRVVGLFSNLGFAFNEAGWRRYQEAEPPTREKTKAAVLDAEQRVIPIVLETINRSDLPLDFDTRVVRRNRPWISRIIGGPDRFSHEINFHPRNRFRYFMGLEEPLEAHELVYHLVQALCLRENIRSGVLSRDYAITTIPGIEQMPNESMAQAMPFFVPEILERMSPYGRFALEYGVLRDMVLNRNALIFANADGYSDEWIKAYTLDYLPGQPPEKIVSEFIPLRRDDPRYRSYYYSYSGSHELRKEAEDMTDEQRRRVITYAYNHQPGYSELASFIEQQKTA